MTRPDPIDGRRVLVVKGRWLDRIAVPGAVRAEALGSWTSPHTGAVYPSGWRLTLSDGGTLDVSPVLRDQELYFPGFYQGGQGSGVGAMAYWEGAVAITGNRSGMGYVELTGYAGR